MQLRARAVMVVYVRYRTDTRACLSVPSHFFRAVGFLAQFEATRRWRWSDKRMPTQVVNGFRRASVAQRSGAKPPTQRDIAAGSAQPPEGRAVPSAAIASRSRARSAKKLEAALRRIARLQMQEATLKKDVQRLINLATQAAKFAYHDELTGLPNRRLLSDRIRQAAARAKRQRSQVALLFLDLDQFKNINDTLGHAAGDKLLQQVGTRLSSCVRITDTVSRTGGDEFVILLPDLESHGSAVAAAEKICAQLEIPFLVADTEISLTASIGLAVYPLDGCDCADELVRQSDIAMDCDKARRRPRPGIHLRQPTDPAVEQR